jgi:plastocyanin
MAPGACDDPNGWAPAPSSSPPAHGSDEEVPIVAEVDVRAHDLYFDPNELHLPAIGASLLRITNSGYAVHNLTVDELSLELVVGRGQSDEVMVVDPPPGRYAFYCSVSGHREAGMEGILLVE